MNVRVLLGLVLVGAIAACLAVHYGPPREPVWKGYRLSEWLDAFDNHLRFEEGHGLRSKLTDHEINEALDGIGKRALPTLLAWLKAKPGFLEKQLNPLLCRQRWTQFRFKTALAQRCCAETGFLRFATVAQPLLPELLRLSLSPDPDMRSGAYEAAFFTRPPRDIFLPLAARALEDKAAGCDAMAAQWMKQRFPEEAQQAGLQQRFPQFFQHQAEAKDELK
jgi:hypothetical protein